MRMRHHRSQSGFTLLEVLLAIGISLTIGAVALTEMRRDNESKQARAVGQQLANVGNALNTYMAIQYDNIVNLRDQTGPGPGTADDPAPRHCTANVATIDGNPVGICTVTIGTLVRSGTLPRNFSGRNAFGAGYELYIRVIGTDPSTAIVDGLAIVNQPYTTGGTGSSPRYDLMGQAMQEAGADSAMSRTIATQMDGLNGTWRDDVWPGITHGGETHQGVNRLGLLGYRAGYGSSAYASFLRRDGTLPMLGSLDMDDWNIDNVNGLQANYAYVRDQIQLNPDPAGGPDGPDRTELIGGVGAMSIRNREGVSIQDLDGDPGKLSAGEITATGNMTLNGDITVSGNIQAQDIRGRSAELSQNLTVHNALQVGTSTGPATQRVTMSGGHIVAGGNIQGNTANFNRVNAGTGANQYSLTNAGLTRNNGPTWFYDTSAAAWSSTADIATGGDIRTGPGGSVIAGNQIVAGGVIEVMGNYNSGGATVNVGSACSVGTAAGKMRRSNTGELVQCINGTWSVMGTRLTTASGSVGQLANGAQRSGYATCPANTTLVGGGYRLTSQPSCAASNTCMGGVDSRSPGASYPDVGNRRWVVTTGQDNGAGTVFGIHAVCAY